MELYNIKQDIDDGVTLNLINTSKFKTNLISIYFLRPLKRDEVTKNALIPLILKRGTSKYKSFLEIQKKLEELYGSNLSIDVNKKGERQVLRFTIEGPDSNYINSTDLLKEQLNMLFEIINNPLIESDSFSEKYVEQEKVNLKRRIEGRINNKKQYAIDRCIEEMCKNEDFRLYKYGYVEDINNINPQNLYRHYKEIITKSPIHISVVGNINEDNAIKSVKEVLNFSRGDIINIPREEIFKEVDSINKVFDEMDVNQGKLTLGYRTNIPYEDKLYEAFLVANNILGGGPNSKLFINVREKASLAYYVYSKSYKYKSIMIIASGIEFGNYKKSLDIIKEQVNELKSGRFDQKDIVNAKNSLITSIKSMTDSNFSISEFYLSQEISRENRSIDDIIEKIKSVSKDDIIKAAEKITLDTIYFLKNRNS